MENKTPRSTSKLSLTIIEVQSQNSASPKTTLTNEDYLLIMNLCNNSKVIPLSIRDSLTIDFENDQLGSKLSFEMRDIKGTNFGVFEISLPANILETPETNLNEELIFGSNKKEKEPIKVKISLSFTTTPQPKKMFKSKPKAAPEKKSSVPIKSVLSGKASPGRRNDFRNNNLVENNEKAFQDYLHNVVTRESARVKNIIEEHNSINECVHMNKVHKNLPFSFGENTLHVYSPQKLSHRGEDEAPGTPQNVLLGRNSVPSLRTPTKKKSGSRETSTDKRLSNTANTGIFSSYIKEEATHRKGSEDRLSKSSLLDTPQAVSPKPKKIKRENPAFQSTGTRSPSPKRFQTQQTPQQPGKEPQALDKVGNSRERKYKSQVEYLSQVIVNIEARLKKNEVIKQENSKLKNEADAVLEDRKKLQEALNEAITQFKEEVTNLQKQSLQLLNQKDNLIANNNELLNKLQKAEEALERNKSTLNERDNQVTILNIKIEELTNIKQQLEGTSTALDRSEQKRVEEQKAYTKNIERFEQSIEELQTMVQELTKEKKEMRKELQQARQELSDYKDTNVQLGIDLSMLQKKLNHAEGYKDVMKSLEDQRNELEQRLSEIKSDITQAEKMTDKACKEFATKMQEAESREKQHTDEITALKEKLSSYEIKNIQLEQHINELELKNKEISAAKYSTQKSEFLLESIKKERDQLVEKLNQAYEDKKILGQQIETLALNHKETNDKVIDLENTITQLQSNLKQSDSQIQSFCQLAEEIEDDNVPYVPLKSDPIDGALADYINTTQGSKGLKLLFMRECEGVYQFGSKKIYIKMEGDRILIRVGGGYLTIDEFIKQNAGQEFERLAKNDPVKLLSRNLAINKMIVGKCVNCFEKSKTQAYDIS